MPEAQPVIPIERIASRMFLIRGQNVMLDSDLAELYGVRIHRLHEHVRRNIDRFPLDFAFQLRRQEFAALLSQVAMPCERRGAGRRLPWAFNERGVAMLSSLLRSTRAVQINLSIIRAFVRLGQLLATHGDVARTIEQHDRQIGLLFDLVQEILSAPAPHKRPIGLITRKD
jgi:hypothetical protein